MSHRGWYFMQSSFLNKHVAEFSASLERTLDCKCLEGISSVQFSPSVMSDSLPPCGLQHARLPCPSPTPGAYSNLHPSRRWCHPMISSSVIPFSSRLQSFPQAESFQKSRFFASGGQSIGVSDSASVLPMNIQDWSSNEYSGLISFRMAWL